MNGWPSGQNLFPKPKGLTRDSRLPDPWAAICVLSTNQQLYYNPEDHKYNYQQFKVGHVTNPPVSDSLAGFYVNRKFWGLPGKEGQPSTVYGDTQSIISQLSGNANYF